MKYTDFTECQKLDEITSHRIYLVPGIWWGSHNQQMQQGCRGNQSGSGIHWGAPHPPWSNQSLNITRIASLMTGIRSRSLKHSTFPFSVHSTCAHSAFTMRSLVLSAPLCSRSLFTLRSPFVQRSLIAQSDNIILRLITKQTCSLFFPNKEQITMQG